MDLYIYNMEEDSFLLVSEEKIGLYTTTTLQNIRYRQIYTNRYKNVISGIENYVQHISFHNLCILKLFIIIMYFSAKITQTFKLKRGKFYFPLALHQHLPPITFLETVKLLLHQMQFSNFLPPGTNAAAVCSIGQLWLAVLIGPGKPCFPIFQIMASQQHTCACIYIHELCMETRGGGLRFS